MYSILTQNGGEFCQKHKQYFSTFPSISAQDVHQDYQLGDQTPDSREILVARREKTKVVLNVGGEKHEVMWRLLERQPRSRLGLLALSTTADQVSSFP